MMIEWVPLNIRNHYRSAYIQNGEIMGNEMTVLMIRPREIKQGDRLAGTGTTWTAQEDAWKNNDGNIVCKVQFHPDGGISMRTWEDDPDLTFEVHRAT